MFIEINRNSKISIKKQLYDALTYKILNKELKHGQKMPSSRQLSSQLSIARNTVTEIYDQLVAEAYLKTQQGKGTFVAKVGHCKLCCDDSCDKKEDHASLKEDCINLIAGKPDLSSFPLKSWHSAFRNVFEKGSISLYDYGDMLGYKPLRKSLVKYLKYHKGIYCGYEQIIITNGTKDALRLIGLSLKDKFSNIVIESPCVDFAESVFKSCKYNIISAHADKQGIIVNNLNTTTASLMYVSPAHQFPLGGTLPISRRQKLVEFVTTYNHIILEDDYDSEFRYKGAPVNSLYQLCSDNVIHLGTFSKTLCPSMRLGYIVIPQHLISDFKGYRYSAGNPPNTINQAILSELIINGFYENHIYKMTKVYKTKMKLISQKLHVSFGNNIEINGCALGLHISVEFKNVVFTENDKSIFIEEGIEVDLLKDYYWDRNQDKCNTLILGFGHLNLDDIEEAVNRLVKAIDIKSKS